MKNNKIVITIIGTFTLAIAIVVSNESPVSDDKQSPEGSNNNTVLSSPQSDTNNLQSKANQLFQELSSINQKTENIGKPNSTLPDTRKINSAQITFAEEKNTKRETTHTSEIVQDEIQLAKADIQVAFSDKDILEKEKEELLFEFTHQGGDVSIEGALTISENLTKKQHEKLQELKDAINERADWLTIKQNQISLQEKQLNKLVNTANR